MAKFGHTRDRRMKSHKVQITLQHRVVVDSVPTWQTGSTEKRLKLFTARDPKRDPPVELINRENRKNCKLNCPNL
jgi:hypothetical protein